MAFKLFRARPERADLPDCEAWPEIGETWQPEGVTISQRFLDSARRRLHLATSTLHPQGERS
ncbi:hypothetical protein [Streptomyces sp. NPDC059788]|uniref:hypothetical protein n=1 Tax=Streptomyces sp. NPDC059788 TaxID=3346948 RepID=UPI003656C45B